jgi:hypothetical protein
MTHRIYVRWSEGKTTHKTTTDSDGVAQLAFNELTQMADQLRGQGALGLAWTKDGQQADYLVLNEETAMERRPLRPRT